MTLLRTRPAESGLHWNRDDSALLELGLTELGLPASPVHVARLETYGGLLLKWNRTYNLLGATDAATLVREHLLDSLAVLPAINRWLPPNAVLLDIGSGAGLPGLVLATMLERLPIVLVEPNGKKAAFLRQAIAHCSLMNVQVVESRIEELSGLEVLLQAARPELPASGVPYFICRAFTSLARFAALCLPHMRPDSLLFAMKAARVGKELEELEALDQSIEVLAVEPIHTADNSVKRNLVVAQSKKTEPSRAFNTAEPQGGSAAGGSLGHHPHDR